MVALLLPRNTEIRNKIEIKRSQFITVMRRTNTPTEATQLIADMRKEFPDARHHCNAYIISEKGVNNLEHSSDDGEPAGTAGKPMLEVLKGNNIVNVSAVVIRYFGGVLLGTGGLVRAYSQSIQDALHTADLVTQHHYTHTEICTSHENAGKIEATLRSNGYDVINSEYTNTQVKLQLAIADFAIFEKYLAEITAGKVQAKNIGQIIRESAGEK